MRIAWFTPLSRPSAIGQFSAVVVRELSQAREITVYAPDVAHPRESWLPDYPVRCLKEAPPPSSEEISRHDLLVYNLGDHLGFHREIYELSLGHPGVVILHDLVMHHFFAGYFWEYKKDWPAYFSELEQAHGRSGAAFGRSVREGTSGDMWSGARMLRFHMAVSAIKGAYGVVVHSRYAEKALQRSALVPVRRIGFPAPLAAGRPVPRADAAGGPRQAPVRLVSYGMLNPNKQIDAVIEAIGGSPLLKARVEYDVIGRSGNGTGYLDSLDRKIRDLGLEGVVRLRGRQSDDELLRAIESADIVVNLRNPHFGETSWSLLEAMFLGKPAVVWKHGSYDEFPDDVVAKIGRREALSVVLEELVASPERRGAIGARARKYAEEEFRTERYCSELLEFAELARYHRPVLELADNLAKRLSEMGPAAGSAFDLRDSLAEEVCSLVQRRIGTSFAVEERRLHELEDDLTRALAELEEAREGARTLDEGRRQVEAALEEALRRERDSQLELERYWSLERELRAELERYASFHRALVRSFPWRVLQAIRRLIGRAW